jgi:hypothetical protein
MGFVLDALIGIVFDLLCFRLGAGLIRLFSFGRVRSGPWLQFSVREMFGSRRDADGTLVVGSSYAVLVGLAFWIALIIFVIALSR